MTKLIICNGKELKVREVGPVIFRLAAGTTPIKLHGHFVLGDEEARTLVRELKEAAGGAGAPSSQ